MAIILFLLVELLDIITTLIGFRYGLWEGAFLKVYTFEWMMTQKVLLVTLVALCMYKYKYKFKKRNWIFPIVAFFPVIWNIFVMIIELK